MIDIETYMEAYLRTINEGFGKRVLFVGLQGSFAREEATENSDIDVVLLLDKIDIGDLRRYRNLTKALDDHGLLCGFVSGKEEIVNWKKSELFQFLFDTVPYQGDLKPFAGQMKRKDIRMAVLEGACNIYHPLSHNFLHEQNIETLKSLYKSAYFLLRAKYCYETGTYIKRRKEIQKYMKNPETMLFKAMGNPNIVDRNNFEVLTEELLEYTKNIISTYGEKHKITPPTRRTHENI